MEVNEYKGIWVFVEERKGNISSISFELIAKSRELSKKTGEEVVAVLLTEDKKDMGQALLKRGADKVIIVENNNLKDYKPTSYGKTLEKLIKKHRPSIFLLGATSLGRDLAPRVMAKLGTGLTADCLDLEINNEGLLVQNKPSYGGSIMCNILCPNHRPQMATIRPKTFSPLEEQENISGEIIIEDIDVKPEEDYQVLETLPYIREGANIEEAEIIVAAGRGIQNQEDMKLVEELASELGGVVGVTRPLVDAEWYDETIQIGASAKNVKPKLIINIGISGAIQYNVGIQGSECIVSINKDANAPIFDISHYGIVGDYSKIIPLLIKEVKNII